MACGKDEGKTRPAERGARAERGKKEEKTHERRSEVRTGGVHVHLEVSLVPGAACYLISARQTLSLAPSRQEIISGPTSKHPPGFQSIQQSPTTLQCASAVIASK